MQSLAIPDDAAPVLVGFSPQEPLAAIARHIGWLGPVLSDPERALYRRLGIGRASWWRAYSPGTLLMYARHSRQRTASATTEDTRQLGADALLRDGHVLRVWRPRSPADRPDPADVWRSARAITDPPPL